MKNKFDLVKKIDFTFFIYLNLIFILKNLIQLKSYLFFNVNIVVIVLDKNSKVKTKLRQIKKYIKLIFFYKNINRRHNLTEKQLRRLKKKIHIRQK